MIRRCLSRRRRGFTLIELLVSIVISALITGAIVAILLSQMQLSTTQNRSMLNQQNLREALDYMAEEISSCGSGIDGAAYISIAAADEMQFLVDIDGDGNWNRIRYEWDDGAVIRTLWTSANQGGSWTQVSADPLIEGLEGFEFVYYQLGNTETAVLADITSVEIAMSQDADFETTAFTAGRVAAGAMLARSTIRNRLIN